MISFQTSNHMSQVSILATSLSKNAQTARPRFPAKMEVLLAILIWLNLLGEVRPVKPIFDLANNMRLVNHFYFAIMVTLQNLEQYAV